MKCCTSPNAGIVQHSGTMLPRPIGADYAVIIGAQEVAAGYADRRAGDAGLRGCDCADQG